MPRVITRLMNRANGTLLNRESSGITRGTALLLLDILAEPSNLALAAFFLTKQNFTLGRDTSSPCPRSELRGPTVFTEIVAAGELRPPHHEQKARAWSPRTCSCLCGGSGRLPCPGRCVPRGTLRRASPLPCRPAPAPPSAPAGCAPSPPMYAVTSTPLVKRTLAILRSAEFGFLGVMVRTWMQTPRRWGHPSPHFTRLRSEFWTQCNAGAFVPFLTGFLPFLTSWLTVGIRGPSSIPYNRGTFQRNSILYQYLVLMSMPIPPFFPTTPQLPRYASAAPCHLSRSIFRCLRRHDILPPRMVIYSTST